MILLTSGALAASGCVYKMSIQQGNFLNAQSVSQLKEGMTRSQVRFLLGTPMVPDAFDDARWDYYYFFSSRTLDEPLKRRLTVYFADDDKVQRFENLGVPTQTDLEQVERDLRKALAETKQKKVKRSLWDRMWGRDAPRSDPTSPAKPSEPAPKTDDPAAPPDPVPSSSPVPAPAGTPSGPP